MIRKKDWITIVYRHWRGESIRTLAKDFDMKQQELRKMLNTQADDVARLESEFESDHTARKQRNGFVLLAYTLCRSREQLSRGVIEMSEKSQNRITVVETAQIQTLEEAEQAIADFELDFGITLV